MRDSLDDLEIDLGRLSDIRNNHQQTPSPAQQLRRALRGKHVCPFCGTTRETDLGACMQCSLEDTPTTRSATRTKLGPWYVLQSRNPSAPGMNFATLMVLVQKGRVTARSVIRGPTTGQFWRHAAKVKGVSREFGLCWNCGSDVSKNARACHSCKRLQEPPLNPDVLLEAGEVSSEDLAEAMWSDHTPTSSQMAGSRPHPAPIDRAPVDRLASKGGVRREVPRGESSDDAPLGASATRAQRAAIGSDIVEDFQSTAGLDMAVFQMPAHRGGYPGAPRPRASFGVLKFLSVAVLLGSAGLVAMAAFDPGFKTNLLNQWEKARAWVNAQTSNNPTPPGFRVDPTPATLATSTSTPAPTPAPTEPPARPVTRVTVEAPKPAAAPPTTPPPSAEQPKLRVWELWRTATEAEKRNDYTTALQHYEAIKALPVNEDDWPLGLQSKIDSTKKRLKTK
jgi:hypothetical protein